MKCYIINDVKLFQTVYRRLYFHNFFNSSNQTSCDNSQCIRIAFCVSCICSYAIQTIFIIVANTMNSDHTAPKRQSVLGPYCQQYRLHVPKQMAYFVNGRKGLNIF